MTRLRDGWGRKIAARGIYRDLIRSSRGHFVKTSGLRWHQSDTVGADPLESPDLGASFSDLALPLGTLLSALSACASVLDRAGSAAIAACSALAAHPSDRRGRRSKFFGLGTFGGRNRRPVQYRNPAAIGCGVVRTGSPSWLRSLLIRRPIGNA
jgi:hypothetical protein